jgi:transcriptional regulator with XRE-family HTH domain
LAHECGINRTYLSGVERSERNVSIDNIARIARGLKVKVGDYASGEIDTLQKHLDTAKSLKPGK